MGPKSMQFKNLETFLFHNSFITAFQGHFEQLDEYDVSV